MKIRELFPAPRPSEDIFEFIVNHFSDMSVEEYFSQDKFQDFMSQVDDLHWSEAKELYQAITGENLVECTYAAVIAKQLVESRKDTSTVAHP